MELGGLTVPVPTLFDDEGKVDRAKNARYARALDDAHVDHLFLLGSLGEFPLVEPAERRPLLESVVETVSTRTDVWVGCGAPSTRAAVAYGREAEEAGATAIVVVPPYYLAPTWAEVEEYYRAIRSAVTVPMLAYNIPSKVGYALPAPLVRKLALAGVLAGIKDTSGRIDSVRGFLDGAPRDFAVLPGDDALVRESIESGAGGAVMGTANIVPALARRLLGACKAPSSERARELQALVSRVAAVVALGPFPSTVKFLAEQVRGAEVGYRAPYGALTPDEAERVRAEWRGIETAVAAAARD